MKLKSIKTLFNEANLRFTEQRKHLFEILLASKQSLPAEEIYLTYLKKGKSINLSTVYRTLDLLVEKGMVEKAYLNDDNKAYYHLSHGHKHYLTCIDCKAMIEIEDCPIHDIEDQIAKKQTMRSRVIS